MRALVQCVSSAKVAVEDTEISSIGRGYLVLLGVGADDTRADADKLWNKLYGLRVFEDADGKTNLSLPDVGGEVLVVSQFTLYADCKRGRRPSFSKAMRPDSARELYEYFCSLAEHDLGHVGTGTFGALMDVSLVNHGPFTIWLDTDEL
ncbi:MAG: D-aminoacyl-tRNA deacylase [Coriobacteriales bacterium]|jgi:D-tyrosyl-tRNA(Tyr) deacylase